MTTSEARILANQKNAALSTGPKTEEGKARSRVNSLKHGLSGAGIVLPAADAVEIERRSIAFAAELNATGDIGIALARRAALNSVRMERGADQQTASLSEHVRQVEADFVPPEGVDEAEADRLRSEAVRIAMFDPSREAALARRYEAAAERGFFRAIKELQQMQRQIKAEPAKTDAATVNAVLGSFFESQKAAREMDAEFDAMFAERELPTPSRPSHSPHLSATSGGFDLPISVGRGFAL